MDGYTDNYFQSGKMVLKNLAGILLVVFLWSLFIAILSSTDGLAASTSLWNRQHVVEVETGRNHVPVSPDPVYTSKRRVPSGPDPVHNRHVGETRHPPERN